MSVWLAFGLLVVYRRAKSQDVFILKGGGEEVFEPHFTYHGFRYIRVEGMSGEINPEDITAVALYSDMPKTGEFTCSNTLIDQLQHNIQWGQQGNFVDIPTDCPQRDERLGWTGDAQVFSRTAAFDRGVDNFFAKWLKDLIADQRPNGSVPFVIPNVAGGGTSTGWADVATKRDLAELERRVNMRFSEHDRRFNEIDRRFESVDRRFESVDRRFDRMDDKLEQIRRELRSNLMVSVATSAALLGAVVAAIKL